MPALVTGRRRVLGRRDGLAAAVFAAKRRSRIVTNGHATRYRQPPSSCCTCAPAMLAKPRF